jgi:hypothetical protein
MEWFQFGYARETRGCVQLRRTGLYSLRSPTRFVSRQYGDDPARKTGRNPSSAALGPGSRQLGGAMLTLVQVLYLTVDAACFVNAPLCSHATQLSQYT